MMYLSGKEAYEIFLDSQWWAVLSFRVRKKAGFKCCRCGKLDHCQAHHRVYREHWFDTLEDDLECICRECHERQHGIIQPPKPAQEPTKFSSMKELLLARGDNLISRKEFLVQKAVLQPREPLVVRQHRRLPSKLKRRIEKRKKQRLAALRQSLKHQKRGRHLNIYVRHHWVSRGNSSN